MHRLSRWFVTSPCLCSMCPIEVCTALKTALAAWLGYQSASLPSGSLLASYSRPLLSCVAGMQFADSRHASSRSVANPARCKLRVSHQWRRPASRGAAARQRRRATAAAARRPAAGAPLAHPAAASARQEGRALFGKAAWLAENQDPGGFDAAARQAACCCHAFKGSSRRIGELVRTRNPICVCAQQALKPTDRPASFRRPSPGAPKPKTRHFPAAAPAWK